MKQYECGCTQPLFRAGHDRGTNRDSKPKGLRQILIIIMKHKIHIHLLQQNKLNLKTLKYLRRLNCCRILKNAEKYTKTLAPPKTLAPGKNLADAKSLVDAKNLAHPKS
jgi:hypothetical protein